MSTETHQQTFFIGDLVEFDCPKGTVRGHIMGYLAEPLGEYVVECLHDEPLAGGIIMPEELSLIVCDYCDSRKGCTCQEDIDAREADWFHRQMDAAERDHWTEDKDRRADEEEEGL